MHNQRQRAELKKSDWFARWRTGQFRQNITYLKIHHKPPPSHPTADGLYDFRAANLRKARLPEARLNQCNLDEAQMFQAILTNATLCNSQLMEADLCNADLSNTKIDNSSLISTRLREANLSGASLIKSDLAGADLTGADLSNANLLKANISGTQLSLANLSHVKNLGTVIGTPSSVDGARIDSNTWRSIRETPLGRLLQKGGEVMDLKFDFEYDVAISFAGEDRDIAEQIAYRLNKMGVRVFYDKYEAANLWGKDLYTHLIDIYKNKAKFCLMLISKHYAEKQWTSHERRAAQARAFEGHREYILPLNLDGTQVEGILPTIAYIALSDYSIPEIATMITEKLKEAT